MTGSPDLHTDDLFGALSEPVLTSMNQLNEIAQRHPDAIALAAGRPSEAYFEIKDLHDYLRAFTDHLADERGLDAGAVRETLFQYGRTKGVVHDLVAENLRVDEGIVCDPEAIVVTVGCQEAMYLVLRALRADARDVLLAISPTYVGLSGAARLADLPVLPVPGGATGADPQALRAALEHARREGLRPRGCYVMPDFANPSGLTLGMETRRELLRLAQEEELLLLEDNPYGLFGDPGQQRLPTLKALDTERSVVYLGSFAKTALPGARVGYLVADQRVADAAGRVGLFADQLSKLKSMLTVNTSPIAQAVVGGKLVRHGCSLLAANVREREVYSRNLRLLLSGLERRLPDAARLGVSWQVPTGGFFAVLTVPFTADDAALELSAGKYGVLWTPVSHFYDGGGGERQLRLSVSAVTPEEIETGLDRLAAFLREQSPKGESDA
ncbi:MULTISPECIES: aminotransferase class I/II-fold pyridoxal phosphate-dependent enzyme [unclassified Streptomyces]|uniref:aminotransferase-like domain-containing protein n=1 Tax=unclassified Streptomyces TaxID=2593676 RepID=UPI0036E0FD1C